MNEKRGLQTMPVAVGRFENSDCTTYWLCLPKVRKNVPERVRKISAFRKAKRRQKFLKEALEWCYVGIVLTCIVSMTVTLLNMGGLL